MKLYIEIDCSNSSFEDNPEELAGILRQVPIHLPLLNSLGNSLAKLIDSNGNTVGSWTYETNE